DRLTGVDLSRFVQELDPVHPLHLIIEHNQGITFIRQTDQRSIRIRGHADVITRATQDFHEHPSIAFLVIKNQNFSRMHENNTQTDAEAKGRKRSANAASFSSAEGRAGVLYG